MINIYQRVTLVNLVNHKGHELPVKEAFERGMATLSASDPVIASAARYLYFDFHTECKNMRFDRVSVLVDRLAESLQGMGWYHALGETQVASKQTGVIRSNCMDCLDRTNVMQSALGKWALDRQLRAAGVLSLKETLEDHADFMSIFRNGKLDISRTPHQSDYRPQSGYKSSCSCPRSVGRSRRYSLSSLCRYWCPQDRLHQDRQEKQTGSITGRIQLSHAIHPEQLFRWRSTGMISCSTCRILL